VKFEFVSVLYLIWSTRGPVGPFNTVSRNVCKTVFAGLKAFLLMQLAR
jgi:hypothetical protein